MNRKNSLIIVTTAAALLLSLGTASVFRACGVQEDGTFMHCHDAQTAVVVRGAVMAAMALLALFVKNKTVRVILMIAAAGIGIAAFVIPGILNHMCMMNTMRCHAVMKPFVRIVSLLAVCLSLVSAWKIYKE